ncbi:MAG TPA: ATP-binding protein, partial [Phenylobacterium sp.]|nr:ATP-binding protein [Phenylobacterium sp.]
PLLGYLDQLCSSIGASMIQDPEQIALTVDADDSVVSSDVSISLGLIVTELVINALRHAFPKHRRGSIRVAYASTTDSWALSVTDDGVGLPVVGETPKPGGLGTSIIEALSRQLSATVSIQPGHPGVAVRVSHGQEMTSA